MQIWHYTDSDGRDLFSEWLARLRDTRARIAIDRRIMRMKLGNFGDHKALREGVSELRIDVGAGYRVYYALDGQDVVVLLVGGDKRSKRGQDADVARACACWKDWQTR